MTTVISLRHALILVVSLGVLAGAAWLGLPRWLAAILAGLVCAAVFALPPLLARRRHHRGEQTPDRRSLGRELARRLRLFAADREFADRGVHLVIGCPGADVGALLAAAGFSPEPLPTRDSLVWTTWRRRGSLLLEVPQACLDESADAAWHAYLDVLPRRLLRRWTRGAVIVARWDTLEAGDASLLARTAELVRDRLRALARLLGLTLPVHLTIVSDGEPSLAPLLAAPLRADRARAWGFRLPNLTDPAACERLAADEFTALTASFAGHVVAALGDPEHVPVDMSGEPPQARLLIPLIPRVQQLAAATARLAADLLAGSPRFHTIWPRGVYLTSRAPVAFTDHLFSAGLAGDAALVRPHAAAVTSRRHRHVAAGLVVSVTLASAALLALRAYRANNSAVADVLTTARVPIKLGPEALAQLAALRGAQARIADLAGWPVPYTSLVPATQLHGPLSSLYHTAVHQSLYLPTLARARARLCPSAAPPLRDADVPDFEALLQLYTLGTWAEVPGETNLRTVAEKEIDLDQALRSAVVRAGTDAVWSQGVSADARGQIVDLLVDHFPIVLRHLRFHPQREDSCVDQARTRLASWRAVACSLAGLTALVPGHHTVRTLLQSRHADALAGAGDHTIAAVFTAAGTAELHPHFTDPLRRCSHGGFVSGLTRADDRDGAETSRLALFTAHTAATIAAWEELLAALTPAASPGCADLATLIFRLAASEGPLHKLPGMVADHALPPPPPAAPAAPAWYAPHDAEVRRGLDPYAEVGRAAGEAKPPIDELLVGLGQLRPLVERGASLDRNEANLKFSEAKTRVENACSLIDPRGADFLRALVKPVFDRAVPCIETGGASFTDPWCAEVAGPFARVLGNDTYPFAADARRDAQLADLCHFYCPQKGAVWQYYEAHLAAVLFATGNGQFVANNAPGFVSFRSYNPALIPFYARTSRLSNLLFPFGDDPEPSIALRVYAPPIDLDGVEVEEVRLELDGQVLGWTNARERWYDLTWPGPGTRNQSGALLRVRGRYHGEPFSEELQDRGVWALFRLLERSTSAEWSPAGDHLQFRFTFAALHGLSVSLELDAGIANELFLARDGTPMAAFRAKQVTPPRQTRLRGARCPF